MLFVGSVLSVFSIAVVIPFVHLLVGSSSNSISKLWLIGGMNYKNQVITLVFLMIMSFLVKNIISFYILSFQGKFFNGFSARITRDLYKVYITKPYSFHISKNSGSIIRNLNTEAVLFTQLMNNLGSLFKEFCLCFFMVSFFVLCKLYFFLYSCFIFRY